MKTKTITKQNACRAALSSLAVIGVLFFAPSMHAATIFFDDFEDGDADGWTVSSSGIGSTGVVDNNGSLRAFASQSGNGLTSLSSDFGYNSNNILSFEMQVIANALSTGGSTVYPSGGVSISFLTQFNVALGTLSFIRDSDGTVSQNQFLIDQTVNNYSGTMLQYAEIIGLNDSSGISKISLEFFARAVSSSSTGALSSSTVWFDNVNISQVPIPAAVWLFGSGLIGLIGVARREARA